MTNLKSEKRRLRNLARRKNKRKVRYRNLKLKKSSQLKIYSPHTILSSLRLMKPLALYKRKQYVNKRRI